MSVRLVLTLMGEKDLQDADADPILKAEIISNFFILLKGLLSEGKIQSKSQEQTSLGSRKYKYLLNYRFFR
jgi:hypothetical protein